MAKDSGNKESIIGLPPGTKVGKYEVRRRMAMGGQSIIYKAYDALLDRYVAIKQISSHLAEDPKFMDRFRKEAQILARLGAEQPSIVTIHELIEDPRGLFIVMEYVDGSSLESILAGSDGPVEIKATLQVLWRLAAALHVVHAAGIIHRDIKPSNIIIKDGLWPTIMDFGVAATISGQTSMVLGTTKYMAPELFGSGPVDGRADMYSLGFVAYELLLGRKKFNEIFADVVRDPRSATVRWMKWHGNKSVQAPSPSEVNPAVPEALSDIVARMMSKDPAGRFENMEALGRAIKTAFSPRASAGAAATKNRRSKRAATGVAAGAPAASADEGNTDDFRSGESEDPDSAIFDSEPTARLPRRSLSVRTKIIIGGIIFFCIIALGVGYGIRKAREQGSWRSRLNRMYQTAETYYDGGRYAAAAKTFGAFIASKEFTDTAEAAKAAVLCEVARGEAALVDGNWMAAQEASKTAKANLENIQSLPIRDKISSEWLDEANKHIERLRMHRINVQDFEKAMAEAVAGLVAGLTDEDYSFALDRLRERLLTTVLDKVQEARRVKIVHDIRHARFIAGFNKTVQAAEGLIGKGELANAGAKYQEARKTIDSLEGQQSLDRDERKKLADELAIKIDKLSNEQAYADATAKASEAKLKGDMVAEIAALRDMVRLRPAAHAEFDERIAKLDLRIELDRAMSLASGGSSQQAIAALETYLKRDPTNQRAKNELNRLRAVQQYDPLVQQGDAARDAKQWPKALEKYEAALRLRRAAGGARRDLNSKIAECKHQLALLEGDRLRGEKKYTEALRQYELAIRYKRSSEVMVRARIDDMVRDRQYENCLTSARALLDKQQFTGALNWSRKADQTKPNTPEVVQLRKDIRYAQYYKLGVDTFARGDYTTAKGYFNIAKKEKSTAEVDKRIAETDQKIKEQKDSQD